MELVQARGARIDAGSVRSHRSRTECIPFIPGSNRCLCRTRFRRRAVSRWRRTLSFFYDAPPIHDQGCPWWTDISTQTVGAAFSIANSILSGSVQLSMLLTFGAGGCSISPCLALLGQVHSGSPAFAISDKYLKRIIYEETTEEGVCKSLECLTSELRQVFASRRALPYEINENGYTLLNVGIELPREHELKSADKVQSFAHGIREWWPPRGEYGLLSRNYPAFGKYFLDLADMGVPINHMVKTEGLFLSDLEYGQV